MNAPLRYQAARGIVCAAVLAASACTAGRPSVIGGEDGASPSVKHEPWRPLHKGHADLATGVYIREDDDLVLNTPLPIVLRRTYNSGDQKSRQFGIDATHSGEWWLYGDNNPRVPWAELILADGGRIHFTRISAGWTLIGALLRHDSTPTEFNGALLYWSNAKWEMQLRDGSTAAFLNCAAGRIPCALIERRDADGHRIDYVRDAAGALQKMQSEQQSIALDYDEHKRIVRAYDTSGRDVKYTYDEGGRLIRAASSDGVVREYTYDARNQLTRIQEPGRIIENRFDAAGRWAAQVVKNSEQDNEPYVATARYGGQGRSIAETYFDEGDGLEVYRFNGDHYVTSETLYADTRAPIVFSYDLDPITNVSRGATMSCTGPSGPITRPVLLSVHDDEAKAALIRSTCVPPR